MGRVSVIIYITGAILLLLLISHSPERSSHNHNRRLKLRSNFSFTPGKHHRPLNVSCPLLHSIIYVYSSRPKARSLSLPCQKLVDRTSEASKGKNDGFRERHAHTRIKHRQRRRRGGGATEAQDSPDHGHHQLQYPADQPHLHRSPQRPQGPQEATLRRPHRRLLLSSNLACVIPPDGCSTSTSTQHPMGLEQQQMTTSLNTL